MGGTINDVRMQLGALVDLGALPDGTDLDAVVRDLGLDRPAKDPTTMSADELVGEIRELTKSLLGYGARLPKELMLFVKDMLFLDVGDRDAGARRRPVRRDHLHRQLLRPRPRRADHPRRRASTRGRSQVDLDGVAASMGLTSEVESITAPRPAAPAPAHPQADGRAPRAVIPTTGQSTR